MTDPRLTHYDDEGRPRMVDVSGKSATVRRARAGGHLTVSEESWRVIEERRFPKGDPFEIARIAGIAAAKKTADLIPLCHPLRLTFIDISITPVPESRTIEIVSTAVAEEKTGVEMESLVATTVALLTIYDMLKAIDKGMTISEVRLLEKSGGKSDYSAKDTSNP